MTQEAYKELFTTIINAILDLIEAMKGLWTFMNTPILQSSLPDFNFDVNMSFWDALFQLIGKLPHIIGWLISQIPVRVMSAIGLDVAFTPMNLLFSSVIFMIIGWIMIKSFII